MNWSLAHKLNKIPSEPKMGKCGGFSWDIVFEWESDIETDVGIILQEIEVEVSIWACPENGEEKGENITESVWEKHFGERKRNFHELWENGFGWVSGADLGDGFRIAAPVFGDPGEFENCSIGELKATGWARYYPSRDLEQEIDNLTAIGWKRPHPDTMAENTQWSGFQNPGWRNSDKDASKLVMHTISVKWNCCGASEHSATEQVGEERVEVQDR
jgi:hypothetical protein